MSYHTSLPLTRTTAASLALTAFLALPAGIAQAEILWNPTASDYGGTAFLSGGPGFGSTQGMDTAFGGGQNAAGIFTMGFTNYAGPPTTLATTDLSGTDLLAGTVLTLRFTKGAADKINFIAIVGDPLGEVRYRSISATEFEIVGEVTDTATSASGSTAASFGLVVDYQNNPVKDFKASVFVTDMHFFDIAPPSATPGGVAGINGEGVNGQTAIFRAFLPTTFLQSVGLTDPSQCKGYIDGIETPPGALLNDGLDGTLRGFEFNDGGDDQVLQLRLDVDEWSAHDIQFGSLVPPSPLPPRLSLARPKPFPRTALRKRSRAQTIRITNLGGSTANSLAVRATGSGARDFLLSRTAARNVNPGASTGFKATFRPRKKGVRIAIFTVRASNAAPVSRPAVGRGR